MAPNKQHSHGVERKSRSLYQRVWRWHFFAGLLVIPFAVILALTGSVYLFKAEIEGTVEAGINERAQGGTPLDADTLMATVKALYPGSSISKITLQHDTSDPTTEMVLRLKNGESLMIWQDVATGKVLDSVAPRDRIMSLMTDIHGQLLTGDNGSLIVEMAASWMIVLIITGLYLWWPKGQSVTATLFPSFRGSKRQIWKEVHMSVGLWASTLILTLLLSGLPWTGVWGDSFGKFQAMMGWNGPGQEWFVTLQSAKPGEVQAIDQGQIPADPHAHHKQAESTDKSTKGVDDGLKLWSTGRDEGEVTLISQKPTDALTPISLQRVFDIVKAEELAAPVELRMPRGENGVWTARSMVQNRYDRQTVHYNKWTGAEIMRIRFDDYHPVKKLVSYGIAYHEGALFGWANKALGVLTALMVIMLAVSGTVIWWKRRPEGKLAAPERPIDHRIKPVLFGLIIFFALFLPMMGISLVVALILEWVWERIRG
ncbi:PepSY domain-containing protein [Kordiimonas sp. SCSIO 12610]|uniref:PepSY-associated TM helix domain-containing protein n=1 Tax=Kordiimonas sp. SCSIO 12610 TaxID=2829597 RepID=UPI00210C1BA9|nr:PepSY domain-containing protein [Kordiimonas sp. SCSIO 12610]UTW56292.1 PepSY domain-containing protein [Kordiimonas sp. SCSIO 12610]